MDAEREAKQVIVIRRDLGMRRGKEIAQGAHAAMAWITHRLEKRASITYATAVLSEAERSWLDGGITKVVCQVPDEATLLTLHARAGEAGLNANLVTDAGRTEFGGKPTITAVAVGPDWADEVDKITGELLLY